MTKSHESTSSPVSVPGSFQSRVLPWLLACFGAEISADKVERNHRFFEEATEVVQAGGMTASEAHQLVDYVYGRPTGELGQEAGGAMVTLAALCLANGLDMHEAGEIELARIWTKVDGIRAKQAARPKHSPLPVSVPEGDALEDIAYEIAAWIDSDAVDGSARFREIVAQRLTAALLSAESRGERKGAKMGMEDALKSAMSVCSQVSVRHETSGLGEVSTHKFHAAEECCEAINKVRDRMRIEGGYRTPDEPWRRCPSTHCERRGECASPNDCTVKSLPAPPSSPEEG